MIVSRIKAALAAALIAVLVIATPVQGHGSATAGATLTCTHYTTSTVVTITVDNPIVYSPTDTVHVATRVWSSALGWFDWDNFGGHYWRWSYANGGSPSYFWNFATSQWNTSSMRNVPTGVAWNAFYYVYHYFHWSDGHVTELFVGPCTV